MTDNIADAVAALARGDVIVFPTETLYGLGADALNFAAVEKVFQLKGRDPNNPFPVLVSDRAMLNKLVAEVSPLAEKLIAGFWPGPLTLVLPARKDIAPPLVNSTGGIGVRISSQPIANEIVRMLGRPLTATSANPSGRPGAQTLEQARNYFFGKIELFVDGGELNSKTGSTVAAVAENKIKIIRAGEIGREKLQKALGQGIEIE
ncbi:MAG: threonylcarbamoyl-AMP synthase [Deltaproteobacteria bacterium]|nr:threonylcarbamoyl-AMP synthase [Deltaproteobacteria bacterium]